MTTLNEDDFDPTKVDRGDNFEPARDEKGRFTSKEGDAKPEDEKAEEEEADDAAAKVTEDAADADADDDDADDEDGEEGAGKGKKDDKNYAIRLAKAKQQRDQARAERAELEARLAALEAKVAKPEPEPQPKVDPRVALEAKAEELYEKVEAARADGDIKTAAKLQRELDGINREIVRIEAAVVASRTTGRMTENQRYDAMLDVAEAAIPELDPRSDSFDKQAVAELQELVEAYEAKGLRPTEALAKAARTMFRVDLSNPPKPEPKKAEAPAKPAPKKTDVAKAVDASRRQPPDTSARGVSRDPDAINVLSLSEDEFNKLPESKKRQLRGDEF